MNLGHATALAVILGGAGLAYGQDARLDRISLETEARLLEDTRSAFQPAFPGGIALGSLGSTAVTLGLINWLGANTSSHLGVLAAVYGGIAALAGVALLAIAIPLIVYGSKQLTRRILAEQRLEEIDRELHPPLRPVNASAAVPFIAVASF